MIFQKSTLIVALVAFCAGAGTSWLVMHQSGESTKQPPSYIISRPASSSEGAPASTPDVTRQSPGESAVTLGNWNYDEKNWAKAIELYQRAISLGMDNCDVRTDLGNAFRFSGEPQKALEQYQIAQNKNPQHENSLYNMATLYADELHDPANTMRTMQEYLRRFPNGDKAPTVRKFIEQTGTNSISGN